MWRLLDVWGERLVSLAGLLLLDSSSLHPNPNPLWEERLRAPRIGWRKDIFQMTRVAHALKWMTCFISNGRLTAFTAHLLLAAPPSLCSAAVELRSLKEAVGTAGAGFHLDYGKRREAHVSCRSKPRLVFDQRPGSWGFSAVAASDFLQPAQSLLRHWCWWAGFPIFRLSVGSLITHKHDSGINLLTQLLENKRMTAFPKVLYNILEEKKDQLNSPTSCCWETELLSRFFNCRENLDV